MSQKVVLVPRDCLQDHTSDGDPKCLAKGTEEGEDGYGVRRVFTRSCSLRGNSHCREKHASSYAAYEIKEDPLDRLGVGLDVDEQTIAEGREKPACPHRPAVLAHLCNHDTDNLRPVSTYMSPVQNLWSTHTGRWRYSESIREECDASHDWRHAFDGLVVKRKVVKTRPQHDTMDDGP